MQTITISIDAERPDVPTIAMAAEMIRRGDLVAFPTETVYGLGANALDAAAVARIFSAKGRPARNPVIVHTGTADEARSLTLFWSEAAEALADAFWPGPLTLVVARAPAIPDIVTGGGRTVGLRVPAHPVARALLRAAGVPIAAPSANRSLALSPTCAEHVARSLDGRIPLILDGGPTSGGVESTVLDISGGVPRLLRPGLVLPSQIEAVIGGIEQGPIDTADTTSGPLPAPGMLTRHYAPQASLEMRPVNRARLLDMAATGCRVGWLTFDAESSLAARIVRIVMPRDPSAYASELYAALHALDAAGVERILVDTPPEGEHWSAVTDRLRRAAVSVGD